MAQFDLYRAPSGLYPFLLDVQADVLSRSIVSRVVVPLLPRKKLKHVIARLNPTLTVDGTEYAMMFQEMAAVPASLLGTPVQSLAARRDELIGAVDLLFTGI